jgi:hypothetical protein
VKKVEDFEQYQSQCKSILQKLHRGRPLQEKRGSFRRSSKFFDDKISKRRADSQERPRSKDSNGSSDNHKKLPIKRTYQKFENFQDKFSEPRLEDYDIQKSYDCEEPIEQPRRIK